MHFWIILVPIWVLLFGVLVVRFTRNSTLLSSESKVENVNAEQLDKNVLRKETVLVFSAALLFRVGVLLLAMFASRFLVGEETPLKALAQTFSAWDGRHYINLVEKGYSGYREAGRPIFLVFFPLYVWVVRFFRLLIPNTLAAGLFVSFLGYAGGCAFVYRLVHKLYQRETAIKAVVYLSVFPFSFFFGGMMTEGIFLLTTAASLYYTSEHKWLRAGIWGALAAMTRMTGLLTAIAILLEYIETTKPFREHYEKGWWKSWLLKLCSAGLPVLGTLAYLFLNYTITGDFFSFINFQKHWFQGGAWLPDTIKLLVRNAYEYRNESMGAAIWIPELVLFVVFLAVLILAVIQKKHKTFLLGYGFAYLTVSYSLSWLLSAGRYLSSSIVFFVFAAVLAEKRNWLDKITVIVSSLLFGVYLFAFIAGAEIM